MSLKNLYDAPNPRNKPGPKPLPSTPAVDPVTALIAEKARKVGAKAEARAMTNLEKKRASIEATVALQPYVEKVTSIQKALKAFDAATSTKRAPLEKDLALAKNTANDVAFKKDLALPYPPPGKNILSRENLLAALKDTSPETPADIHTIATRLGGLANTNAISMFYRRHESTLRGEIGCEKRGKKLVYWLVPVAYAACTTV